MALSPCGTITDKSGKELVNHGTTAFPIGCYHDDLQRQYVPWHWHGELEAAIVTEGEAMVAADSERFYVKQGDAFFVNTGVLHGCWNVDDTSCRFHSIVFHPRLVGGSVDCVIWQNYLQPVLEDASFKSIHLDHRIDWQKEAIDAVEEAWSNCVNEPPGYEFQVRNALSRLIYLVAAHKNNIVKPLSAKTLRDGTRIKLMLEYIQRHFYEDITIDKIAQCADISESECLRCFKKTIGTTPIQYLKSFRIQKAAELLENTDEKIVDIGIQCGFQDMSYFSKSFRKVWGDTPSEYRKRFTVK